ncbi:MAG: pantetheine-phosphate adenylyltransferase [Gammaproteobacteria bacterium]|nr:pantetheine-phosphate adenylyltransferase [Gammaproteobacteria bacterium]
MAVTAVYPGTFDPITNGHVDIAKRAASMFDRVYLAVAEDTAKQPILTLKERVSLAQTVLEDVPNVEVVSFSGLLVNFAIEKGARAFVRGLRAVTDFEYEMQLAGVNRELEPRLETVFIAASHEYQFISSSMVREIARLDGALGGFVHPVVEDALKEWRSR